ncbi:hypothetical protein AB9P05_18695 [Roseivirga sp. BDSF3-8]|uniref:hypothetical protein n=1 Tax=Roseivirga sp. BDSF3-8 TaxID=3241598 RepID=UPI0035327620
MASHFDLSDDPLEQQMISVTLDPSLFTHEAHLRLAWVYIRKYGVEQAIDNIGEQIRQFAAKNGAPDKYNQTVTEAAVRIVYHFYLKASEVDFHTLIEQYPRLKTDFISLLRAHYSFDLFQDAKAKRSYLQPDLLPFD